MASGIKGSGNRPKAGKHMRGNSKTKRHKNDSEKQAAYKSKVAARRAKKNKK
jgi:hypothetical protein